MAADDVWSPPESSAAWQDECGACHMAFPPALLTKDAWHLLMEGLHKHFGVDASMAPAMRDEIAAFLERNAGSGWSHSADSLRITETPWFVKRHRAAMRMARRGKVSSLADCAACHKGPGTGFDD